MRTLLSADRPKPFLSSYLVQTIDVAGGHSAIEEGGIASFLLGRLNIPWRNIADGACQTGGSRSNGVRVVLKFVPFKVGGFRQIKYPGAAIGWQDHTYLDHDLRIICVGRVPFQK